MINWTIKYEPMYSKEEMKPVQDMILREESFNDLLDETDLPLLEEAYIDLAIQLGWDADRFVNEVLEEQANLVLSYDGENSKSLSKMMGNAAIGYIECYLRGEDFDDSYDGKQPYWFC